MNMKKMVQMALLATIAGMGLLVWRVVADSTKRGQNHASPAAAIPKGSGYTTQTALPARPPSPNATTAADPAVYDDVRQGATVRLTVAPGLPEFTLKFLPDGNPDASRAIINKVEVHLEQETEPVQVLTDCEMDEPPYRGAKWVTTDDMNFDGYRDIQMLRWWGATGREGYCVWIFNPATRRFEHNPAFEFGGVGGYGLDPAHRVIKVRDDQYSAGRQYTLSTYRVAENKPVLSEFEEQKCAETGTGLWHVWYQPAADQTLIEVQRRAVADEDGMCRSAAADITRRAQIASAATVEPGLPDKPLGNWFKESLGATATISWETNDCGEFDGSGQPESVPVCADMEATFPDGRTLSVWIVVGSQDLQAPRKAMDFSGTPVVWSALLSSSDRHLACGIRLSAIPELIDIDPTHMSPEQVAKWCGGRLLKS
jgi:hypothetical protein